MTLWKLKLNHVRALLTQNSKFEKSILLSTVLWFLVDSTRCLNLRFLETNPSQVVNVLIAELQKCPNKRNFLLTLFQTFRFYYPNFVLHPRVPFHTHQSVHFITHQSVHPNTHQSVHPNTHQSVHPTTHQSVLPNTHQSVHSLTHHRMQLGSEESRVLLYQQLLLQVNLEAYRTLFSFSDSSTLKIFVKSLGMDSNFTPTRQITQSFLHFLTQLEQYYNKIYLK